jgi:hypothetical protein
MIQTINGLIRKVPAPLNLKTIQDKFPSVYEESMNTVLPQEAVR